MESGKTFVDIENGDRIAVGGMNIHNCMGVAQVFEENGLNIEIVGGWNETISGQSLTVNNKVVPLFKSVEELLQCISETEQPEIIVLPIDSTNISHDIELISKAKKHKIRIVIMISGYKSSVPFQEIKRITMLCRRLNIEIRTINLKDVGYCTGYLLGNPKDMPWTIDTLDMDLMEYLQKHNIISGSFLDLGTGAGTQAVQLSKLGFEVTASDLVKYAFEENAKKEKSIQFIEDDILNTKIDKQFDYIFDRGCLHALKKVNYDRYVNQVKKILKDTGILFLKYGTNDNSHLTEDVLAYYYSEKELNNFIEKNFKVVESKRSIFEVAGMKSTFAVLKKC